MSAHLRPLWVTAALALLVFVQVPATLYLGNLHEFMTAPRPLAGVLLAPVLLIVALAITGLRLARRNEFSRFTAVIAALTLLAWAQAYLLMADYGALDGQAIDWDAAGWRGWIDLPLWLAVLAGALIWHRRLAPALSAAALIVVALQFAALAAQAYERREGLSLKPSRQLGLDDLDAMPRFAPKGNVLHLVLDSFQADVFADLVRGPDGTSLRAALTGFTFFEENLGTFPLTHLALPALLSGQVYRNHMPRPDFMETVFGGNTVLNAAYDAGFEVDLASDPVVLDQLMKGRYHNAYLPHRTPLVEDAARLLDLALFRLVPHRFKRRVHNDEQWVVQGLMTTSVLLHFRYFTHNVFLADVTRRLATDRAAPVYKYFHLMTPHAPLVVDAGCRFAGATLERVREHVTAQSRCSLDFAVALLQRMKAAGIYDSALIVIMGDHGGHLPPHRYRHGHIREGNYSYDLYPSLVGLATPLLLVKPPAATQPFRISTALTSSTDVAATIDVLARLGGGLPGRSLFEPPTEPVERRFYAYPWTPRDPISRYMELIQEYRVSGSAYDLASWRIGPLHLPPDGVRR